MITEGFRWLPKTDTKVQTAPSKIPQNNGSCSRVYYTEKKKNI